MKRFGLLLATFLGFFWRLIPSFIRIQFITGMFILESRHQNPKNGLKRLFLLRDRLDWVVNERAMKYGQGVHPKHRLIGYHHFFIQRISNGETVLDVGCGYGAVARSIAHALPESKVLGIDRDWNRLKSTKVYGGPSNLNYIQGDATQTLPCGQWDVVLLSNVLEHIVDRVDFLNALKASTSASRYLIRVPLFERDWQMPLRRELGVDYRSDDDHKVEHTLSELLAEISAAGLVPLETKTLWGEIWVNCEPLEKNANN